MLDCNCPTKAGDMVSFVFIYDMIVCSNNLSEAEICLKVIYLPRYWFLYFFFGFSAI